LNKNILWAFKNALVSIIISVLICFCPFFLNAQQTDNSLSPSATTESSDFQRGSVAGTLTAVYEHIGIPTSLPGGTVSGALSDIKTTVDSFAPGNIAQQSTLVTVGGQVDGVATKLGTPSGSSTVTSLVDSVHTKLGTPSGGDTVVSILADILTDTDDTITLIGNPSTASSVRGEIKAVKDVVDALGSACTPESSPFSTGSSGGVFCLTSSFSLSASQVGVTIDGSNVEIDLAGQVINGNNLVDTIGINIDASAASIKNIRIKNGTIANCRRGAIILDGSSNTIQDVIIENIMITGCNGASATVHDVVSFVGAKKVIMRNCTINNNGNSAHDLTALRLNGCTRCTFEKIEVIDNAATNFSGFVLQTGTSCTSNVWSECTVRGHEASSVTGTFVGFSLESSANKNIVRSCIVSDNEAGGSTVTGFSSTSTAKNNFVSCLVHSTNSSAISAFVRGFYLSSCTQNNMFSCIASDQSSSAGTAIGFDFQSSSLCSAKECTASRNIGNSAANSMGFNQSPTSAGASGSTLNTFIKNVALANSTTATGAAGAGGQYAGFDETQVSVDGINTDLGGAWHNVALTGLV